MDIPTKLLDTFIHEFLVSRRRQRIQNLVATKSGLVRFQRDLFHQLGDWLDERKAVSALPPNAWLTQTVRVNGEGPVFESFNSLRDAFDEPAEAILCITVDGRYAAYRPETYLDGERFYVSKRAGPCQK